MHSYTVPLYPDSRDEREKKTHTEREKVKKKNKCQRKIEHRADPAALIMYSGNIHNYVWFYAVRGKGNAGNGTELGLTR